MQICRTISDTPGLRRAMERVLRATPSDPLEDVEPDYLNCVGYLMQLRQWLDAGLLRHDFPNREEGAGLLLLRQVANEAESAQPCPHCGYRSRPGLVCERCKQRLVPSSPRQPRSTGSHRSTA